MEDHIFKSNKKNDVIDVEKPGIVDLEILSPEEGDAFAIKLSGKSMDYSIVNAIRRTVLGSIPIYAFHRSDIHVDRAETYNMYNNDMLYQQIETLPIFNLPNHFDVEDPELYLPNDMLKKLFGKFTRDKLTDEYAGKNLFHIEMTVTVVNNTAEYRHVDSHDIELRVDGKIVDSYKIRDPITLIVLKPEEKVSLVANAVLGISYMNSIFDATTVAYHNEIDDNTYVLKYNTLGQLNKKLIFKKACVIMMKKLENLKTFIEETYIGEKTDDSIDIDLYGEDHTLGNLLTTALQKCKYTIRAGYYMPHPLEMKVTLSYQVVKGKKVIPVLLLCIVYLVTIYKNLTDKID
jgi:DNA-directed RNA polymerase subunit L